MRNPSLISMTESNTKSWMFQVCCVSRKLCLRRTAWYGRKVGLEPPRNGLMPGANSGYFLGRGSRSGLSRVPPYLPHRGHHYNTRHLHVTPSTFSAFRHHCATQLHFRHCFVSIQCFASLFGWGSHSVLLICWGRHSSPCMWCRRHSTLLLRSQLWRYTGHRSLLWISREIPFPHWLHRVLTRLFPGASDKTIETFLNVASALRE